MLFLRKPTPSAYRYYYYAFPWILAGIGWLCILYQFIYSSWSSTSSLAFSHGNLVCVPVTEDILGKNPPSWKGSSNNPPSSSSSQHLFVCTDDGNLPSLKDRIPVCSSPSSSSSSASLIPPPSSSSSSLSTSVASSSSFFLSPKTLARAQFDQECEDIKEEYYDKLISDTVRNRLRWNGTGSPPFIQSSMAHLHPCIRTHHVYNVNEDVLFVILASTVTIERVRDFRATWGKNLKDNVVIIGDANDTTVGMITLPVLAGKGSVTEAPHRTLQGLIYIMNQPQYEKYSWIFMIDDDTWVNTRELSSLLYGWDVRVPMMFGFFWNNPNFLDRRTWPSGGAGMLITRSAARKFATNLYTNLCPFDVENDRTLGNCALQTGIAMVHSPLFDPEATSTVLCEYSYFNLQHNDGDVRTFIAIHRAIDGRMQLWQETVDNYPDDTALAEKVMEKY